MDEKEEWILKYLGNKKQLAFIDILDEDFVSSYIDEFNAKFKDMVVGSPRCKELSNLLSFMYKKGLLRRYPHGVRSSYNQDYVNYKAPKWVYSYELPKQINIKMEG